MALYLLLLYLWKKPHINSECTVKRNLQNGISQTKSNVKFENLNDL